MSIKSVNEEQVQEEKLEDILRSIRGMIDNHGSTNESHEEKQVQPVISKKEKSKSSGANSNDSILELTDEFVQGNTNLKHSIGLVSNEIINKSASLIEEFKKELHNNNYRQEDKLELVVIDLLKPLLRDWLDHNLPKLVEKMIAEELKRLIPKSNY